MNKTLKFRLATIISLIVIVLLFAVKFTGALLHMLLGIAVVMMILIHMIRKLNRLSHIPFKWKMVDMILVALSIILLVTGIFIHPMKNFIAVLMIHKCMAVFMAITCVIHVVQHRKRGNVS